ncbi:MAG: AMP-binding protein [Myxococcales bacterium]|nr:AMP-binding protein [Myxococcales bacterium]
MSLREHLEIRRRAGVPPMTFGGLVALARDLLGAGLSATTIFRVNAANFPDKAALLFEDEVLSYRGLLERVLRLAAALHAEGVRPGDRVVTLLRNSPRCVEMLGACQLLKAVHVPTSWRLKRDELAFIFANAAPRVVVFEADLGEELIPALDAADLQGTTLLIAAGEAGVVGARAYERLVEGHAPRAPRVPRRSQARIMMYTSGTTGRPKGAIRSTEDRGASEAFFRGVMRVAPLRHDDVHLTPCPLYHTAPWSFMGIYFTLGGTTLLMERFDPEEVLRLIERHRVTTCTMVPTMYQRIVDLPEEVKRGYDVSSIRALIATGSLLPVPLKERVIERFGEVLYDFYGATELGWVTVATPEDLRVHRNTLGRPFPGTEIRLLDDAGAEVPVGEVGEIYARNPFTFDGYYRDADATAAMVREGFHSVGDMAWRDHVGYYFMADRKSDLVVSGGVNIYPAEIEQTLVSHPKVAEAAVIGVPDPEWGESLQAFVVPKPGRSVDEARIIDYCAAHLAGYKKPKAVTFVDALPRNAQGKVLKRELREAALRGSGAAPKA